MRGLSFTLGLLLGLAGGLYFAWQLSPVEYVETAPDSLQEHFRDDYLALIAAAYSSTGDLVRARARLALFPDLDPVSDLSVIAQRRLARELPDAPALAQLAADLDRSPQSAPTPQPISVAGSATPTRRPPTATPRPTATPGAPFTLEAKETLCDPNLLEPLIQVEVFDAAGDPVSGVEVTVIWDTGQDHFFTGLKPELGTGYGDFSMTDGVGYSVRLEDSNQPVTDLSTHVCESEDQESYLGSWLLRFEQLP